MRSHILLTALSALLLQLHSSLASSSITTSYRKDVHILLYDSKADRHYKTTGDASEAPSSLQFFRERSAIANVYTTVYGGKLQHSTVSPSNSKFQLLRPLLEVFPSNHNSNDDNDPLVIVGDADHVAFNVPEHAENAQAAVDTFVERFHRLTQQAHAPAAVVFAADDTCSTLLLEEEGTKKYDDVQHEMIELWKNDMSHRADEVLPKGSESYYIYLNSGLLVGRPQDMLRMLDTLQLDPTDDDESVLTSLMLARPDLIVLDYQQELFGTNTVPSKDLAEDCRYMSQDDAVPLVHTELETQPLLLQTSGQYHEACLDFLIEQMGGVSQERYLLTSSFFDLVADFNAPTSPGEDDTDEVVEEEEDNVDHIGNFFGAGNDAPQDPNAPTTPGNYGTMNGVLDDVFSNSVDEEKSAGDGSNFQFPDPVPPTNYGGTNYGSYGNYGNYGNYGQYGNYGGFFRSGR